MKKKEIILSLLFSLLLSGCSNKSKNAIEVTFNYDIYVSNAFSEADASLVSIDDISINVNAFDVYNMLVGESTFLLYIHSPYCSHCEDTDYLWAKYVKEHPYSIYAYFPDSQEEYMQYLNTYDNINFPEQVLTPRLLIASKGKILEEIKPAKITGTYSVFKSTINAFTKSTKTYTLSKNEALDTYLDDKGNDSQIYIYDSSKIESIKKYNNESSLDDVLTIDINLVDNNLQERLKDIELNTFVKLN